MAAELSLRAAQYPDCAPELIAFRNLNRGISRDRAYFDWRYLGRPCTESPTIIWAEIEGRRVGALTVFPHDFHVLDREWPLGILGDISVREDCRGLGIARAMFRFLAQAKALRGLFGGLVLPNEDAARALRKSGWHDANRIERFAKVLDFRARMSEREAAGPLRFVAAPLNLLTRYLTWESFYQKGRFRAVLVSHLGDAFDELWKRAHKHGKVIAVRNARYLRWRYQHHPVNRYSMLAVMDGDNVLGYAMFRFAGKLCYVEDVFCRDPRQHAAHVVGSLLVHLREQSSAAGVSVSINRSALNFPWRTFGFLRRADYQQVMTTAWSSAGSKLHALGATRWHITAGDKDV